MRYSLGPPTDDEELACEFTDAVDILRPADELEGIHGLRRRADGIGSWPLTAVAKIRENLIIDMFSSWGEPFNRLAVFRWHIQGLAVLKRWTDEVRGSLTANQQYKRDRIFEHAGHHMVAGLELLSRREPARPRALPIGASARIQFSEIVPLLQLASRWIDLRNEPAQHALVARARRVSGRGKFELRRPGESTDSITYLDRVDALLAIWETFPAARTTALLRDASQTLGFVLRDPAPFRTLLERGGRRDDYGRRTIVICLGLLGEFVEPDHAIRSWSEYDDTVAWVLATVLADWTNAEDRIRDCDRRLSSAGRRITDTALMRLAAGAPFSVVG